MALRRFKNASKLPFLQTPSAILKPMKKVLFGIFAHPDDESFGPAGTIIKEVRENSTDVHIITITPGDGGVNPDGHDDLGAVRLEEWREAGRLLGVSSQHNLGYRDGYLSNHLYHEVAEKITSSIDETLRHYTEPVEIDFMTFDVNGLSGHIDHIFAARVACYVFYSRKPNDERFRHLRFVCIPRQRAATHTTHWLYADAGRDTEEGIETVDARHYHEDIVAVMRAHYSQRADCEHHLAQRGDTLGIDYFIVKD